MAGRVVCKLVRQPHYRWLEDLAKFANYTSRHLAARNHTLSGLSARRSLEATLYALREWAPVARCSGQFCKYTARHSAAPHRALSGLSARRSLELEAMLYEIREWAPRECWLALAATPEQLEAHPASCLCAHFGPGKIIADGLNEQLGTLCKRNNKGWRTDLA